MLLTKKQTNQSILVGSNNSTTYAIHVLEFYCCFR